MKFAFALKFVANALLVHRLTTVPVLSCSIPSKIDAISYLDYKGIAFVLSSNSYYYVVKEEDIRDSGVQQFEATAKIPHLSNCCDSAILRDLIDCKNEEHNEHSIAFIKLLSADTTKYLKLNISSLLADEQQSESSLWTEPKSITSDVILSDLNIDYSQPIDAIFHTDNTGEYFFIQGEFYSGIEFHESCPQTRDEIKVFVRRKLSEINVFGKIDSAYYEPRADPPILYLTNYERMQFFKVSIDSEHSTSGRLVSIETTAHPIASHPLFSRICAPNSDLRFNSSLLSADGPIDGITIPLNGSTIAYLFSYVSLVFSLIFYFCIF